MCDTFVALANATEDGSVIFGKNSDRDANEAHELVIFPHAYHAEGEQVKCTYIDIPQVPETNAVLLAKPFWIWGAEMGANEHNVVVGNEAVFSKLPAGKEPGLIGMDYLRLALERASTALEAVEVITKLLEKYGQSGNCGFAHKFYYHNSYLIADPNEAWVLETVDKHWAAERVTDIRSISNGLTIGKQWDLASEDLERFAKEEGWCKDRSDFDFKRCYSDFLYTKFSDSQNRVCRTKEMLNINFSTLTVKKAFAMLRDHGVQNSPFYPDRRLYGAQVCMHASSGPIRGSQTTGSMVVEIKDGKAIFWLTGTSAPCTSVFKPVWLDSGLPLMTSPEGLPEKDRPELDAEQFRPTGSYDPRTLWWHHEDLHRETLRDYPQLIKLYQDERDQLEDEFLATVEDKKFITRKSKLDFSQDCFDTAWEAESGWLEKVKPVKSKHLRGLVHKFAWKGYDKQAGRKN